MKKSLLLAISLAAVPFACANAGDLSYTYVEGGYTKLHLDDLDAEGDGPYLRGSAELSPSFYAFGGAGRASDKIDASVYGAAIEVDVTQTELGIGYRQGMGENVDFIAELSYLRLDVDASASGFGSADEQATGGRASLGLRGQMAAPLEGWVKVGYIDGGDFEGNFAGTLGGQYQFGATWGLVGEVEIIEEATRYTVGVRASF